MEILRAIGHIGLVLAKGPIRNKPAIQHPLPRKYYDPLWGAPGFVHEPRVTAGRSNVPIQNTYVNTAMFTKPWSESLANNPIFWDKYHLRKTRSWGQNYDPMHQLTYESYPLKQNNVVYTDIGIGARLNTNNKGVPFASSPYEVPRNKPRGSSYIYA
jgi:hypothetical protein